MNHKRLIRGFTLIELLAVITIIGILATLAAVGVANASRRARDGKRQADLTDIKNALELYNQDNGSYPVQATAGKVSGASKTTTLDVLTSGGYMQTLGVDPKDSASQGYFYVSDATGSNYVVYVTLEYSKSKETISPPADCSSVGSVATKGNGVVSNDPTTPTVACFRLSND